LSGLTFFSNSWELGLKDGRRDWLDVHFKVKLSPKEHYPFGKNGEVIYKGCSKKYPLNTNEDLKFRVPVVM
jgi:hypothetical protein